MTLRGTASLLANLLLLVAFPTGAPARAALAQAAVPTCRNGVYLISGTTLTRLDTTSGRYVHIATLPRLVNALAYADDQNLFYGVAGARIVTIDPAGHLSDQGPAPAGTSGAYAGAILGDHWYVRNGGPLRVLSVDPHSAQYLKVIDTVPVNLHGVLGDWDINPADGRLYGLATGVPGPVRLIRIDPHTGTVTVLAHPADLPNHSSYGGVMISAGVLSAVYNPNGTVYSLPLVQPDRIVARSGGAAAPSGHDDAAACPLAWDFGDAPARYGTTLAQDGPRHLLTTVGQLTIGSDVDADPDGAPGPAAAGDSDDGLQDPVVMAGKTGKTATLSVPVRNTTGAAALLAGWLDSDGDGTFEHRERALATVAPGADEATLRWSLPHSPTSGSTFARLRLFGQIPENPNPLGPAYGGEVEDHRVELPTPPPHAANPVPPPVRIAPRPTPKPKPTHPHPTPASPVARVAAARADQAPPWAPKPTISLTWSVVILMLIPAAACTVRAAGRGIRRHR